jgi:hypothetical protein
VGDEDQRSARRTDCTGDTSQVLATTRGPLGAQTGALATTSRPRLHRPPLPDLMGKQKRFPTVRLESRAAGVVAGLLADASTRSSLDGGATQTEDIMALRRRAFFLSLGTSEVEELILCTQLAVYDVDCNHHVTCGTAGPELTRGRSPQRGTSKVHSSVTMDNATFRT